MLGCYRDASAVDGTWWFLKWMGDVSRLIFLYTTPIKKSMWEKEIAIYTDEDYLYDSYLIEEFTKKPVDVVFNDYSVPQLIWLSAYISFIKCNTMDSGNRQTHRWRWWRSSIFCFSWRKKCTWNICSS